jgi:hypothetical protein
MFGIDPALLPRALGTSGTTDMNLSEKTHIGPAAIREGFHLGERRRSDGHSRTHGVHEAIEPR